MKTNSSLLTTIAVLAWALPLGTQAATHVYDLSADWSDTDNPNGTWSYVGESYVAAGDLLVNTPFPWVIPGDESSSITKITDASAVPGYLEGGDVSVSIDSVHTLWVGARWTAPASGVITISGAMWQGAPCDGSPLCPPSADWTLTLNGSIVSQDRSAAAPLSTRSTPYDLSSGSGGADALQNIAVAKNDLVELAVFETFEQAIGVGFTITFTPDSLDPSEAIQQLATDVVAMNLQNGIANSLDSKLDAALNALDDVNTNNDGAACNSLAAFINAVEAQRGNKLTESQADQLIAAAQEIQASLNCGD